MRDDSERIRDIQESIEKIEKYSVRGKTVFFADELIQTWIIHHLQIIGEASSAISQEFKSNYPQTPWVKITDFRNIIVYEYFRVNLDNVWSIVEDELPQLKAQISVILQEIE